MRTDSGGHESGGRRQWEVDKVDCTCLDASVLVKLYVPETGSDEAERLVREALEQGQALVGPCCFLTEVLSVLRTHVQRGTLTRDQAEVALDSLFASPIEVVDGRQVYERAWRIVEERSMPVVYDAV